MELFKKKYQIFISSTFKDLIEARSNVIQVILSLYQIPIGMEMFSADNDEQWETIKSTIDSSDYYLLIIAHRYGSLTKEKISYTEKEFDYAKKCGIPILSFIKNRDSLSKPSQRDDDIDKTKQLERFVKKVQQNSMIDFWENEAELGQKVAIALPKVFFKTPRIGWSRSDSNSSQETAIEITKLVQENRELRDEISKIKAKQNSSKPKFKLLINSGNKLKLSIFKPREIHFKMIEFDKMDKKFAKYSTREEVELYNNMINEKKEQISVYKKELNKYHNITYNHTNLRITIMNIGDTKANDVYIDMFFPEEIVLFDEQYLHNLKKPKNPISLKNPFTVAVEKYNEKQREMGFPQDYSIGGFLKGNLGPKGINIHFPKNIANREYWIDHKTNKLTIKLNKLSHTRTRIIDDELMIAPSKRGKFKIDVEIISDELKTKIKDSIVVEVE